MAGSRGCCSIGQFHKGFGSGRKDSRHVECGISLDMDPIYEHEHEIILLCYEKTWTRRRDGRGDRSNILRMMYYSLYRAPSPVLPPACLIVRDERSHEDPAHVVAAHVHAYDYSFSLHSVHTFIPRGHAHDIAPRSRHLGASIHRICTMNVDGMRV